MHQNTFLALGKFVVEFSRLLHYTESATVQLIAPIGTAASGARMLALAALADRTAYPIVSSYFSVFHQYWEEQLTPADIKILQSLRTEIEGLVTERNRLMHDSWQPVSGGGHDSEILHKVRIRAHGKGANYEAEPYAPSSIDQLSERVRQLTDLLRAAVSYARPGQNGPELDRRMEIRGKQVYPRPAAAQNA